MKLLKHTLQRLALWTCHLEVSKPKENQPLGRKTQHFTPSHAHPGHSQSSTPVGEEEIWSEETGAHPEVERGPLRTPGWPRSDWAWCLLMGTLLAAPRGWSTCRRGFQRTASSWIPGGATPRPLRLPVDSRPWPRWHSCGTDPTTWDKESRWMIDTRREWSATKAAGSHPSTHFDLVRCSTVKSNQQISWMIEGWSRDAITIEMSVRNNTVWGLGDIGGGVVLSASSRG